ncbi:hypothetical protein MSG28_006523 [Choristoneura fumiferana]|uniref:Uncharacterized protein n=1 Tax=Choristoneura fumiferana TaxID=7141 RepID=A0ACC0JF92_CHOFU|nr:hypothetical protein MSG28_006523 [Choristoneura fumiferana]
MHLKKKCQHLLRVAKRLFTQVASLDTLLQMAMDQAKHLIRAEYCAVMLIDVDRMEFVETYHPGKGKETAERRYPMNVGIAGYVVKTGALVNAKSAKDHPAFDPDVDSYPGIDVKTILTFPIREQTGIIGVGQLINKIGDPYFDAMDEEMALAFSIYCGVCIIHSVVYQKLQEAHIRNALANELVMYHMQVADSEVAKLMECTGFHGHPHLSSLHFNQRALPMRELPCYALKMFEDLGFVKTFNLKRTKLCRFILHVKKGYRDVPYHSWLHSFNVAQWAYAAMINYKLVSQGYFNDLQAMMYLIAGLVHDLDHRGTTNSFQIQGQTTLAALYSSEGSVMERHHLAQAICILNTQGCDILEALPRRDYDRALILLRDFVLASDLANYFKNLNEYKAISLDYQKGNRTHIACLQALLMNAADLTVLTEFFKQGDVEKSRGDLPPIIMDRDKCVPIIAGLSVLLSPELDNLIELNLQEKERLRLEAEAEAAAAGAVVEAESEEEY